MELRERASSASLTSPSQPQGLGAAVAVVVDAVVEDLLLLGAGSGGVRGVGGRRRDHREVRVSPAAAAQHQAGQGSGEVVQRGRGVLRRGAMGASRGRARWESARGRPSPWGRFRTADRGLRRWSRSSRGPAPCHSTPPGGMHKFRPHGQISPVITGSLHLLACARQAAARAAITRSSSPPPFRGSVPP